MTKIALLDKDFFKVADGTINLTKETLGDVVKHNERIYVYSLMLDDETFCYRETHQPYTITEF